MKISDMQNLLASTKAQHGNIELLCGFYRIAGIAVLQPDRYHPQARASILMKFSIPAGTEPQKP
jgi:hypothetical protein